MKLWNYITSNYYINVAILSWFLAQVIKVILTFVSTKRVNFERFVGSGGMPSSHSSFTVSVAVAMARKLGFASPEFALAFVFTSVVMYDAMGVRRAAGEQARVLNRMMFELSDFPWFLKKEKQSTVEIDLDHLERLELAESEDRSRSEDPIIEKELKEFLGHTPLEVVMGCLLGIVVALFVPLK